MDDLMNGTQRAPLQPQLTILYSLKAPAFAVDKLVEAHYLHRRPPISFCFTVSTPQIDVAAVLTFGTPPSRHLQLSACPAAPSSVLELNRVWVDDRMPKNSGTRILSACLKRLPGRIIVSYADTAAGHVGYQYRAANFFYAGLTDADRKTPRFDYVPRNGKHSRDAFRSNDFDRVRRLPKHRYWTVTGTKKEKRELAALAGWPKLSWKADQ